MSPFQIDVSKISSDKIVLFDVDGVLLDLWTPMYLFWKQDQFSKGKYPRISRFVEEEVYGYYKDTKSYSGYISGLFENQDTFENLRPKKGMVETVHALKKMGYDLAVITAASNDKMVRTKRCKNLFKVFGDVFNQIHCIGSDKKGDLIKSYASLYKESAFCDDNPGNVQQSVGVVTYPVWRFNQSLAPLLNRLDVENSSVMYNSADLLEIVACSSCVRQHPHIKKNNQALFMAHIKENKIASV